MTDREAARDDDERAAQDDSPGDAGLTPEEREKVEEEAAPRAVLVHEIIREEGENELARPSSALALSGLAAGLSMGFSFLADALIGARLPDAPWERLVSSFGYCVGFIIAVLGRQQLFTESTLTAILPLLYRRDGATLAKTLRLWTIVLATNLVGTALFAFAIARFDIVKPEDQPALLELAKHTIEGSFSTTAVKAVFSGWLIALMIWLLPAAGSAKLLVIIVLTYLVALAGLPHVIAGSSEAAYLIATGNAGWSDYAFRFLAPTLLGNTVGGVLLVAILNHGTVATELDAAGEGQDR